MQFLKKVELFCKEHNIVKKDGEINLAKFSRNSGIPYTTIDSWYKKGTENIKLSTLIKLVEFTNLSLDYWANDNIEIVNNEMSIVTTVCDNKTNFDELEILLSKNKEILTDDDKETIKFLIEKRKRETDKQLDKD